MFFENDRTFCSNTECKHTECYRHQANVIGKPRFLSIADFEGTKECKKRSMTELEMRTANNILRVMKEIDERECKQSEEQSASNEEKCEVEC